MLSSSKREQVMSARSNETLMKSDWGAVKKTHMNMNQNRPMKRPMRAQNSGELRRCLMCGV